MNDLPPSCAKLTLGVIVLAIVIYEAMVQLAYFHVESITKQYGAAMQPTILKEAERKTKLGASAAESHLEYFKVFDVVSDSAKVLVVVNSKQTFKNGYTENDRAGWFWYLKQQDGKWQIDSTKPVDLIWEQNGSMDGVIWPPYH